jgi:type I restriction enzyme S subunit
MSEIHYSGEDANGSIGDIAEINPKTDINLSGQSKVSFLAMQDTSESGEVVALQERNFSEVSKGYTRFAENDVLVAKITPCFENGKGGYAKGLLHGVGFGSTEFHVVRATPGKADARFLHHLTRSEAFRRAGEGSMTGSAGQKRVPVDFIKEFPIFIPPLPEQKKIAEILSGIDKAIERANILLQKEMMALHAILNEQIADIDHRFHKRAGELLEGNILTALKDGNHGEQYPRKEEFKRTGVPYLSASSISDDGDIDLSSCPCLSAERSSQMRIPPAEGGDVILTHNATIGKVGIIHKDTGSVVASTSTTYYRTNEDLLMREFLAATMRSEHYQNQLKRIMGQTTRNQVPITAQRELMLILPPKETQNMISQIYSSSRNIRLGRVAKIKGLHLLKDSLCADLLSGRKRVSV